MNNQYRIRFSDFVGDEAMTSIFESVSSTCHLLRGRYIAIHDDTPAGWSFSGTLSYVGLGSLAGAKPAPPTLTEEQQRDLFQEQYVHTCPGRALRLTSLDRAWKPQCS